MRRRTDDLELADLDIPVLEETAETTGSAEAGSRGLLGTIFRALTLPVRLAGGAIGLVVIAVVSLVRAVLIPIRLGARLIAKVLQLASDLVYGIWRVVLWVVGAILGLAKLVLRLLNATVGALVRLVFRSVRGVLRALLWAFTLGRLSGARKARKELESEAAGEVVVETVDEEPAA